MKKRLAEAAQANPRARLSQAHHTGPKGLPRIVDQPPLIYHPDKLTERERRGIPQAVSRNSAEERRILFDRFKLVDVAIKVVGVGSVGTRCYVVLLLAAPDDPLFLQVKEARHSVLERYTGPSARGAQRPTCRGRATPDAVRERHLPGLVERTGGRDFYVRQLRDMKMAPPFESQTPGVMHGYATLCGLALARAHDKAGDAAMIAGYLGSIDHFDEAIGDYAVAYADQVERDYRTFVKAVRSGRLKSDLSPSRLETALR